eukprot:TRINITY_DN5641_c1_g1_i4.p1 TRINITY_DN5641_c1_g1~~TRINITY_DN5641_c1_g1_i4.p1  ORF type:complete len:492 (+),score=-72.16 TRINITY_DN5641_c1_g1_i4:1998-3473(+)
MRRFMARGFSRLLVCYAGLAVLPYSVMAQESPSSPMTLRLAYEQAVESDPTFAKALADWNVQKWNVSLARAAYLPQASLQAQAVHDSTRQSVEGLGIARGNNYQYGLKLSLYQPLFNLPAWKAIKSADAGAKAAAAAYMGAKQDLMLRVSQAYLAVLEAQEQIGVQQQRLRALAEQRRIAVQQVRAGNSPATARYDAQSQYDQAAAVAISLNTQKDMALERLFEITGARAAALPSLHAAVPLQKPPASQLDLWVEKATQQNYYLLAKNYAVYAAKRAIGQASTQWLPQLNFMGQYENQNQTRMHGQSNPPPTNAAAGHTDDFSYGLALNFPFLQGGAVSASTQQNIQKYLSLTEERNTLYRSILSQTRQAFLNIVSGVAQIQADRVSLQSAQYALSAIKASYRVGARTLLDVLTELAVVYDVKSTYITHQYQYLLSLLNLKYSAGTLSAEDVYALSAIFSQPASSVEAKGTPEKLKNSAGIQDLAVIPLEG